MEFDESRDIRELVRAYYGETLQGSDDLKTDACCCTTATPPKYVLDVMDEIEDDIMMHFYGCGSPIPPALAGATVLDLGCGTGRDVYLCSKLVGPAGRVIGVDMTEQQLAFARRYEARQMERFGFAQSNVEFHQGFIEDLTAIGIEDDSVDVVISNCVINLSPFKDQVFAEIARVLKPGAASCTSPTSSPTGAYRPSSTTTPYCEANAFRGPSTWKTSAASWPSTASTRSTTWRRPSCTSATSR